MATLEQREQNLLNATETMAQFYDEIESFLSILYSEMERAGFFTKIERLRSGTFTVKNLTRRLLASASIMYIKDAAGVDETEDEEVADEEELELEEKHGKDTDVTITKEMVIPLLTLHLFTPRTIPTAHTLSSPELLIGAIADIKFIDRKTGTVFDMASHTMGLSNFGQIYLKPNNQIGNTLGVRCWKPKSMRNYKVQGKLIAFENLKLLEIDTQEKIRDIAKKLSGFCELR